MSPILIAFGVTLLVGAIGVGVQSVRLSAVTADRDRLQAEIEAPVTGWAARQAQCQTNVVTLDGSLAKLAGEVKSLHDDTMAADARNAQLMAEVNKSAAGARDSAARVLALPKPVPAQACMAASALLKAGPK